MVVIPDSLDQLSAHELRELLTGLMTKVAQQDQQIAKLDQTISSDAKELVYRQTKIDQLTHEMAVLKRHQFGRSREQIDSTQVSLLDEAFDEDLAAIEQELKNLTPPPQTDTEPPKKPKRAALPANLARVDVHHEPDSTTCKCGCQLKRIGADSALVSGRCIELGYPPEIGDLVSVSLGSFLAERQIGIVRISALISQLRGDWSGPEGNPIGGDTEQFDGEKVDWFADRWGDSEEGNFAPLMLDGLQTAASKGNALAHYALALIHAPDNDEDTVQGAGSPYWHSQAQKGHVLTGVEKEWADAHAARLAQDDKYARHLREAGRLGNQHALLDLAERFDDPSFFEVPRHDVGADPSAVAEIAERLGRVADAKHWLTMAAESGDTRAMLRLIEEYDHGDLARSWTWVYLSRLVGTDLSKDDHYAINEDGSEYDDDVGGPVYAAGRNGVDLESLSAEQDATAKDAARDLFDRIQRAAAPTHRG